MDEAATLHNAGGPYDWSSPLPGLCNETALGRWEA
jgi:hypothetical protein